MDEVAHQPAWLQEDGSEDRATADGGAAAAAGVGALLLHERAASNGAADFIGLDNGAPAAPPAAAAPYANGNGHVPAPPAVAAAAAGPAPASAPAAQAPARDPLEDLLSLSAAQQAEPPKPGRAICFCFRRRSSCIPCHEEFEHACCSHCQKISAADVLGLDLHSEQDWTPTSRLIVIFYGCGSAFCVRPIQCQRRRACADGRRPPGHAAPRRHRRLVPKALHLRLRCPVRRLQPAGALMS